MTSPNADFGVPSGVPGDGAYLPGVSNLPTPARLTVGIVSAGRVGTALGAALERSGHVVAAVVAHSEQSRARARSRLPESQILDLDDVVARSELLVISVPDAVLPQVVAEIAISSSLRPGTLVAHTAGAHGVGILDPITARGGVPLALHPAMTFVGTDDDTARLAQTCFGITAADDLGDAIASSLVLEMGGEPVRIAEADRTLYHAALAHGANNLVALMADAVAILDTAIDSSGRDRATVDGSGAQLAQRILAPLVTAALANVLELGPEALTGPVARGDADAVARHLRALRAIPGGDGRDGIAEAYRTMARRASTLTAPPPALLDVLEAP